MSGWQLPSFNNIGNVWNQAVNFFNNLPFVRSKATVYTPEVNDRMEGGAKDKRGNDLLAHTFQDVSPIKPGNPLDFKHYVALALDKSIPYKTPFILQTKGENGQIESRCAMGVDCGSAFNNKGLGRVDIASKGKNAAPLANKIGDYVRLVPLGKTFNV